MTECSLSLTFVADQDIRKSYKGGWTYLKDGYSGKIVGKGMVLDVNGLYYAVMENEEYPVGEAIYYKGKYSDNGMYPLYIQMIECTFKLKEGYLPTIQIKKSTRFNPTEYVKESGEKTVLLTLTCVDLALFLEHYEVDELEYIQGWKFKGRKGIFTQYVNKWVDVKINSEKEGNMAQRAIAKMYLTNLYGKFAKNPKVAEKIPVYSETLKRVTYQTTDFEIVDGIYIPVGTFVTAYGRNVTIRSAQALYDRFIYSDTDSLHLEGWEEPKNIKIDKYELGAWKIEAKFTKAKFLRAKCYMEEIDGNIKVTCAGLPRKILEVKDENGNKRAIKESDGIITFDNFDFGLEVAGALKSKRVEGGTILRESTFKIRR